MTGVVDDDNDFGVSDGDDNNSGVDDDNNDDSGDDNNVSGVKDDDDEESLIYLFNLYLFFNAYLLIYCLVCVEALKIGKFGMIFMWAYMELSLFLFYLFQS